MLFTETLPANEGSVTSWRAEQASIREMIRQTRNWIREACLESPPCDELRSHVQRIRDQLVLHFQRGSDIYVSLCEELWCVEVDLAKRYAQADQKHLLERLVRLIANLESANVTPASFEAAATQLEWFFDELDLHEEREAESFDWLLQSSCG